MATLVGIRVKSGTQYTLRGTGTSNLGGPNAPPPAETWPESFRELKLCSVMKLLRAPLHPGEESLWLPNINQYESILNK